MMSYFDNYKKRLLASGNNELDAMVNNSTAYINKVFSNSPYYKNVLLNGTTNLEVRMLAGDTYFDKNILLKPNTTVKIGDYIKDGSDTYLVIDFINKLLPRAKLKMCTHKLKWDSYQYDCFVMTNRYFILRDDLKYDIDLSEGSVLVYAPANPDTLGIKLSTRVVLGSQVYEIVAKDDLSVKGLVRFTANVIVKTSYDDINNGNTGKPPVSGGDHRW